MNGAQIPVRRWVIDLVACAVLLLVPIVGFFPTFGSAAYLPAAIGGLLLGMGVAVVSAWRGFGVLVVAGLTLAVYLVFGGPLALPQTTLFGVVPTVDTLVGLVLGVVTSWKELLTTVPPVPASDGYLIVPFLLSLVAAVLTVSLALRLRQAAWALAPAAAFLMVQIALGTSIPAAPIVEGVVFAAAAAGWLAVRQSMVAGAAVAAAGSSTRGVGRRVLAGAGVVALAVGVGVVASGFAAPEAPRYVLRDTVIPPFDVRDYPSPLQAYRAYVRDSADDTLFTMSGMPKDARVRIAAMDAYSGTVYNVSDGGGYGSSSAFTPVRGGMAPDARGDAAEVHVTIGEYDAVWMPQLGAVEQVTFAGDRADDMRRESFYNAASGTGIVIGGLAAGDEYDLDVVVPEVPDDKALAGVDFANVKLPTQEGVPDDFAAIASDVTADAETSVERVRALQEMLSTKGFFSHGLQGEVVSRAGHTAERITTLLGAEQMVGDDEQYAVAMALLAREVDIPARVVMGFYPAEDEATGTLFEATGDDLHAWVEVAFEGYGWVPFDPTPPEDQQPSDVTTKPRSEPKPQVLQPPPPLEEPADLPPTVPDDRGAEDEDEVGSTPWGLIAGVAGVSILVVALLLAPFIVIGALKASRRRRRREAERPSDRISGGWDELVDRAADYGAAVSVGGTRTEDADALTSRFAEPRVTTLAARADVDVFGPADPTPADIDEFWRQVDEIVGGIGRSHSVWRRMRARLSLRSLLAGTRFALAVRTQRSAPAAPAPEASAPADPTADTGTRQNRRTSRRAEERAAPPQETP
ncbi:hypothetical protein JOD63_002579 [Microbacterium terrae]|uniref:Transglutaminase-like superfamily protein n=1 Tax=Microbacterium terrae TaxID=69369 RepID=A0A0M2HJW0_9MICO|nr:transglutaminaseTgpA domain-containing protein [Microbacterium terrae]KJL44626.1 Transglutaminase-like superfamily protein [Microbacterium terrae]MBP1078611.1 hypothetical protein [Microbacterium terrae]GLJ98012.1 cysteine protease [Microbacterium terrae]